MILLKNRKFLFFALSLTLCFTAALGAQENSSFPNYKNELLDSFNGEGSGVIDLALGDKSPKIVWKVAGSQFIEKDYPRQAYVPKTWPVDALGQFPADPDKLQVLGIKAKFDRFGYNIVELTPGYENPDKDNEWTPGIVLNGIPKNLSIWVWGGKFDYTMEAHIRDNRGVVHAVDFLFKEKNNSAVTPELSNSLKFMGWRHMVATIPSYIGTPDLNRSLNGEKIKLLKIVFRSSPNEQIETPFYVYLDELRLLTNNYSLYFDGSDLAKPDKIKEIWDGEKTDKKESQ